MTQKNILVAIITMILMVVCGNNAAAQSVKVAGLDTTSTQQVLKSKSEAGNNGITWLNYSGNRNIQLEALAAYTDDGMAGGIRAFYMTRPWNFSVEYRHAKNRSALLAGISYDLVKSPYSAVYPSIEIQGGLGEQYVGYTLTEDFKANGFINRDFLICKMKLQGEAKFNLKIVPFRKHKQFSFTLFGGVIGRFNEGKISANDIQSDIQLNGIKVEEIAQKLNDSPMLKKFGWIAGIKISHTIFPWGSKKK